MIEISPTAPVRIARPTRDLAAAERFWVDGVGLAVIWHTDGHASGDGEVPQVAGTPAEHALTMLGVPGAGWHLELVADAEAAAASIPGDEDLLVIYLGELAEDAWLTRIEAAGGRRVPARNPYWDRWGITIADPDGYLLVLSHRTWG
jgi:catechol 2,3-dioxygenase-like lactoylglutathione lyase family enzyme